MRPTELNLTATRGDDFSVTFQFLNDAGSPLDLSPYTMFAVALAVPRPTATVVATFLVTEGNVGFERVLSLAETQTAALPNSSYWYLHTVRTVDGYSQTWLAGRLDAVYEADAEIGANQIVVAIGAERVVVVGASNIGPPGPPGPTGLTGPQGTTGLGVPPGGASGQVLVKRSNADYDTEWQTP